MAQAKRSKQQVKVLPKSPAGVPGMDEITGGGLPKGRPTLVAGSAGCGKTLFAMESLSMEPFNMMNRASLWHSRKMPKNWHKMSLRSVLI